MYITYHPEITKPDNITSQLPHAVLSEELKSTLKEWDCVQPKYYFKDNGMYFFLYLDNGDRIDCLCN